DTNGMLFANRSTWAHVLAAVAEVTGQQALDFLTTPELDAVHGQCAPAGVLFEGHTL
ncbi:MAG: hypothetical protein HKN85_09435, partial [Gammaproteobacteria bacterium]|nr:hypothetical protein [Gammaproteobacteria bacterium]